MRKIMILSIVFGLVSIVGCASTTKSYTRQDVNKEVGPKIPEPHGYLKVYTETTDVNDADVHRYPHLPYTIFTPEGKKIMWVKNSWSSTDKYPEVVELAPGKYVIVPAVWMTKREVIGATIENGKITEIHLAGE